MKTKCNKKTEIVENEYSKCKAIINKSLLSNNCEKALAAISMGGYLLYSWNQCYTDNYLEESLKNIAESTNIDELNYQPQRGSILFYDGFGLDVRGLALIYLKALANNDYHVVYVTNRSAEGKQPEIDSVIQKNCVEKIYLESHKQLRRMKELQQIVADKKPQYAFLYTTPNDSSAIVVFMQMRSTKRYLINLTDHAFWLGVNAFDYCIEFRNYGASISALHRHIPEDKLKIIPFYPIVDKNREFDGFPFDTEGKKVIFSGGSVYKTIDTDNTYYRIIDRILEMSEDSVFVFASNDENRRLEDVSKKHPGRVYHIQERSDLYQCMRHCTLYMNTYPLLGGLMTQYAVVAERIPLSLQYDVSSEGLLINQENRKVFYNSEDELIKDALRLLQDEEYRNQRTERIKGSVISPVEFDREVVNLLQNDRTSYSVEVKPRDIKNFQDGYAERFDINKCLRSALGLNNICLYKEYKGIFIDKIMRGGVYEDCSKDSYEVSILICTYNPDFDHLKYAINSALLQNDVSLQIVITDDGTKNFDAEQIIDYFEGKGFHDFAICRLPENKGTVKNFRNGLSYCKGTFVRGLSPEDYIYGCDTLRKWVDYVSTHNAVVSFSNVICYKFENEDIVPVKRMANPQSISNYYKGCWGFNYLVFNDICVGAGILVKRDIINFYSRLIEDNNVIYAEDNSYRLMAMKNEAMVFYNHPTALYEVGNGISTSNYGVWRERLGKDWEHADEVMLNWAEYMKENDILRKNFKRIVQIRHIKNKTYRRIARLLVPGYFMYWIRTHISPRFTSTEIDSNYIEKLKKI